MADPGRSTCASDDPATATLELLLDEVVPYPAIPDGPAAADTAQYVRRRLEREDAPLRAPLGHLLATVRGRERAWVAAVADDPDHPDHDLFVALRGWAWDGFLADPRWGVNQGGLGWTHVGWAGPPRRREQR